MALLYPKYEEILNLKVPPTQGELKLLNFLKDNLNDEYEIFFQPFLNGDCPDIVVMRKGGGVLIIEVKDWNLKSYSTDGQQNWFVKHNKSKIKSPIDQVLKYKENLYDLHIDNLLQLKLRDYKYWYIVHCAIFFFNENDFDVMDFLLGPFELRRHEIIKNGYKVQEKLDQLKSQIFNFNKFLEKSIAILGKNTLNKNALNTLLSETWISRNSYYFTEELYDSFKRHLKPSFHSFEEGKNINYSKKQLDLIVSEPGEKKIRGLAGSGKTLVLAKKAVEAYKRTNERVLVLTYNISLKNYIHDKISDVRDNFDWSNFHIVNYHDFFNSTLNNLNIEFNLPEGFKNWNPSSVADYLENHYYGNLDLFDKQKEIIQKYNSILIDEVQDFKTIWLRIIKKYFLEPNGEFVVLGDSKQDIYNRVSLNTSKQKKELVIPESPGRWSELNESYRLTPTITAFASAFQKEFLGKTHEIDEFENFNYQSALFDRVHYKNIDGLTPNETAQLIFDYIKKLNLPPNDIGVLSLSVQYIRELDYRYRKLTHEKTYLISETKEFYDHLVATEKNEAKLKREIEKIRKNKKLHFWMNSGLTKFSTIHSYKGWEVKNLFLITTKSSVEQTYKELIYTGFTRCMDNLIILNVDDIEFENFVNKLEFIDKF